MKRIGYFWLLSLILVGILSSCASGRKAYLKGNYEKSVYQALVRLKKNPQHKESRDIIKFAYPAMLKYYEEKANGYKRSSDVLRWDKTVDVYAALNKAYDEIQRTPAASRLVDAKSYQNEYEEARAAAADIHYAQGVQHLTQRDRASLKAGYSQFQRALEFRSSHPDAARKLQETREELTVKVVVQPIPMHSAVLSLSNEFFENQLMQYFRSTERRNEFVQYYSVSDRVQDPDQFLVMRFDDFQVGQMYIKEKVEDRKRDNVISGKNTIKKDSVVNVYGTVTAQVRTFEKTISSGGLLDVKLVDAKTNNIMGQQKFPGTFVWQDRWAFFNGDERALTDADRQCVGRRESPNPPPQNLFIEFTKPIFNQVTGYVEGFYRNF